jgi:hypothetical protein
MIFFNDFLRAADHEGTGRAPDLAEIVLADQPAAAPGALGWRYSR